MLFRAIGGSLLGILLTTLLLLTTPVGAGQGVHASMLLDPVLPHVHLLDGRIVTDAQLTAILAAATRDQLRQQPVAGPALGTGGPADAASLGVAVAPTVPENVAVLNSSQSGALKTNVGARPDEFRDSPQDPPPDRNA